jgi:hypothetical protein
MQQFTNKDQRAIRARMIGKTTARGSWRFHFFVAVRLLLLIPVCAGPALPTAPWISLTGKLRRRIHDNGRRLRCRPFRGVAHDQMGAVGLAQRAAPTATH